MNNEPVAWMWWHSVENKSPYSQMTGYSQRCFSDTKPDDKLVEIDEGTLMPLYTHPEKTLTDEEIDEIASMCSVNEKDQINDREFARAILRKAQENG